MDKVIMCWSYEQTIQKMFLNLLHHSQNIYIYHEQCCNRMWKSCCWTKSWFNDFYYAMKYPLEAFSNGIKSFARSIVFVICITILIIVTVIGTCFLTKLSKFFVNVFYSWYRARTYWCIAWLNVVQSFVRGCISSIVGPGLTLF